MLTSCVHSFSKFFISVSPDYLEGIEGFIGFEIPDIDLLDLDRKFTNLNSLYEPGVLFLTATCEDFNIKFIQVFPRQSLRRPDI